MFSDHKGRVSPSLNSSKSSLDVWEERTRLLSLKMNVKHKILQQNFQIRYSADGHYRGHLDPRRELCLYLKGVAEAHDVPSYVKDHPFGQPAVTSAHPHWEFYSRVKQSLLTKRAPKIV